MSSTRRKWGGSVVAVLGMTLAGHPQLGGAQEAHKAHDPQAAHEAHSPLAEAPRGTKYPDGSERPQPRYEKIEGEVRLQVPEIALQRAPVVAFGAAAQVQSRLPEGFTLREAGAVRVMGVKHPAARARAAEGRNPIPVPGAEQGRDPMAEEGPQAAAGAPGAPDQIPTPAKWFVNHPLEYRGVPLSKYTDVLTIVGEDGRLLYERKRNLPSEVDATRPTVEPKAAIDLGRRDAAAAFGEAKVQAGEATLQIWVDAQLKGHLAWAFTLSSDSQTDPKGRHYWVAAVGEPRVLDWESTIYHTHFGTTTGTLWQASPLQPTQATVNRPLRDHEVTRIGAGGGTQITGEDGRYGFPTGVGNATSQATLRGPFSVIENLAGAVMTRSSAGTPAAPIDLNFGAANEFETAQVTAFYWTNATYHFARSILDPLPAPQPFRQLPTRVNSNSTCNAFWNGSSITFFRAGAGCPNTAYADVVAHEYGHGIDHWRGGILDGGYSEGFGDAVALLLTRQSCVGRDFFGVGTCLRNATDVNMWPPAGGEGVHAVGRRYGQFTWQLVQELKKTYSEDEAFRLASELVLAAAAGNPSNIPDAVRLSFLADDNDGDLSNGSPHFKELAAAADSRNIPRPANPVKGRIAFAWANDPTSASYTPTPIYSSNPSGGTITITRSGTGIYAVRFAGFGGGAIAGGHVQVTAYGSGSETAKVASWGSFGTDFIVNVRGFNSAGNPVDTRYNVLVLWP